MRIPEPGPLGETLFDANTLAIVFASLVNSLAGGWVESVFTSAIQRFVFGLDTVFPGRKMPEPPETVYG